MSAVILTASSEQEKSVLGARGDGAQTRRGGPMWLLLQTTAEPSGGIGVTASQTKPKGELGSAPFFLKGQTEIF